MKIKDQRSKIKIFSLCVIFSFLAVNLLGCEALVRKFTRKPKKEAVQEELVLAPQEYKGPQMTKEEQYRQYFLFWKSWEDELVTALVADGNHKKQVDCAEQAVNNLLKVKAFLVPEKQNKLDSYIGQLVGLKDSIAGDVYGRNLSYHRAAAERIKRNILRDFSYPKVKDSLL
jgi:hypothetical protein